MSIFIDSNVFIAFMNRRDMDHERAKELVNSVRRGSFGLPYTSDYVFDEAVTTTFVRTRRIDLGIRVGKMILGSPEDSIPKISQLLSVDEPAFKRSWLRFSSGSHSSLSFTDHTIITHMETLRIDSILSFDTGFDGIVPRIS